MKKFLLIMGGVVVLAGIAFVFYMAGNVWLAYYIAAHNQEMGEKYAKAAELAQQNAVNQETQKQAQLSQSLQDQATFFVDPNGYQTEDNWLATGISRELAEMTYEVVHPGEAPPDIQITARVDPDEAQVHVEISGFGDGAASDMVVDLTPTFVWEAHGYAPLAQKLLGTTNPPSIAPGENSPDILAHLQSLTAYNLAQEDVRLSANLQQSPASWQDHEAAALALTALALRENAGWFSDERRLLNRATAHLAVAEALRQNQNETWPGLIADAAVRTLAGREIDALAHLDSLAARTDCPASAKPWITALRLKAGQDWRVTRVTSDSPLLVQIVWFQVLANDLTDIAATHRLDAIFPAQSDDSTAANNQTQSSSVWDLPDWGRAVLVSPLYLSVDNGHRFTENNITLELKEINDVMKVEGGDPITEQNVSASFSEGEGETVSKDANGKVVVQVIGRGTFKAATRRHLFVALRSTYSWMDHDLGLPEDAVAFRAKMDATFRGLPQSEFLWEGMDNASQEELQRRYELWHSQNKVWQVGELAPGTGSDLPGYALEKSFYARGVPFGTVYRAAQRLIFINDIGVKDHAAEFNAIVAQVKKLSLDQQIAEFQKLSKPFNAMEQAETPHGPTPVEQKLLALAPDNYDLLVDHLSVEKLLPVVKPMLAYNIRPVYELERVNQSYFNDATREMLWRDHAALDPDGYFGLAGVLRDEGKFDEAAEMDRKGVAGAYDVVLMSNSVWDLVDYDLAHGRKDEAEKVAQDAADTGSRGGMEAQMYLLEKEGQLDQAAAVGNDIVDRYGGDFELNLLYARHKDHFPDQYLTVERQFFPHGMDRAELASFYQKPDAGCQITGDHPVLKIAGLRQGDVIVALDGHAVRSKDQYLFVRALSEDPKMDFVVWRNGKYVKVEATLPERRFYANIANYGTE